MENIKILLIDNPSDIMLLNEFMASLKLPVQIHSLSSIANAVGIIEMENPDLIIIGSCILLHEGFEILNSISLVPIVVFCEDDGFHRLIKDEHAKMCFITKPMDIEMMPTIIERAYEFWISIKEE